MLNFTHHHQLAIEIVYIFRSCLNKYRISFEITTKSPHLPKEAKLIASPLAVPTRSLLTELLMIRLSARNGAVQTNWIVNWYAERTTHIKVLLKMKWKKGSNWIVNSNSLKGLYNWFNSWKGFINHWRWVEI